MSWVVCYGTLTSAWVSQLSASHSGIKSWPWVITDSSPHVEEADLHTSTVRTAPTNQPNVAMAAGSCSGYITSCNPSYKVGVAQQCSGGRTTYAYLSKSCITSPQICFSATPPEIIYTIYAVYISLVAQAPCFFLWKSGCINFKWVHLNLNITKIEAHALSRWRAIASVQRRWPWAEMTEVEARMATYSLLLQIINSRLPTGSTEFRSWRWLRSHQVRATHKGTIPNYF